METHEFIENSIGDHLTLADINKLSVGDILDVVIWDRNYEEYWMWTKAVPVQLYSPEEFYKQNRHQLKYLGDYQWDITYPFGETHTHPLHLWVGNLRTTWEWYELQDGWINVRQEYLASKQKIPIHWSPIHKHISEFEPATRVGWRGPIMLWSKLADKGKVFYDPDATERHDLEARTKTKNKLLLL